MDKKWAKCNMVFGRITKIYLMDFTKVLNDAALLFVVQCALNHLGTSGSTSTTPMWIHQREGSELMEEAFLLFARSRAIWTFAVFLRCLMHNFSLMWTTTSLCVDREAVVLNWPSTPHWCPTRLRCKSCRCCKRWRVAAKWKKEKTCNEFTGKMCKARLVVLAAEVGSRWSQLTGNSCTTTNKFLLFVGEGIEDRTTNWSAKQKR